MIQAFTHRLGRFTRQNSIDSCRGNREARERPLTFRKPDFR